MTAHNMLTSHPRLTQFVKYLLSGSVYFWIGYGVFFVCDKGFHWDLWWAKLTANVIGRTANYLLQRYWAFAYPELGKHTTRVTAKYIAITAIDFLLDYCIVFALKASGITPYIGQFVSAGFFTAWNYVWYRWWVFAHNNQRREHADE